MIGMVAAASLCPLFFAVINFYTPAGPQLALLMLAAALTSRLKVKLPGMTSTMSGNLPVILLAVTQMGFSASLLVAITAAVAQSFASGKQFKPVHFLFNTCTLINASAAAYAVYHSHLFAGLANGTALALAAASAVYFLANTMPVAGIIGLTETQNPFAIWRKVFLWSFPNYVIGAGLTALASMFGATGMITMGSLMLVLFGIYKSYAMFVAQSEQSAPKALAMAATR